MTFSHKTPTRRPSPSTPNPAHNIAQDTDVIHAAYIAAISPAVIAVMMRLLAWIGGARPTRSSGRFVICAKTAAAMSALAMILVLRPGTLAQKKALLEHLFTQAGAKLKRLYTKYLVWRQRKCWMWGGGFMATTLAALPSVFVAALDETSFDALIPD